MQSISYKLATYTPMPAHWPLGPLSSHNGYLRSASYNDSITYRMAAPVLIITKPPAYHFSVLPVHQGLKIEKSSRDRMSHPAWPIVVQQPCICCDMATLCRLLCVSKDITVVIKAKCARQVSVHFKSRAPYRERQFALWLAKFGSLLAKHVELHTLCSVEDTLLEDYEDVIPVYHVGEQLQQPAAAWHAPAPALCSTACALARDW